MLKEKLKQDMKKFMKEKKKVELSTVRLVNAGIKNEEIKLKRELTEEEVLNVVLREVKQTKETLSDAIKFNNKAIEDESNIALSTLNEYLPKQLTVEEAREIVIKALSENGITELKDRGNAMKIIMPLLKGKIDGKSISNLVVEALS